VVVPAPCVWVLFRRRDLLDLLENLDVGLGWCVAVLGQSVTPEYPEGLQPEGGVYQRCDKRLGLYSDSGVLRRLINTDQSFSSYTSSDIGCVAVGNGKGNR